MDKKTLIYIGAAGLAYYLWSRGYFQTPAMAAPVDPVAHALSYYPGLSIEQYNLSASKYPSLSPTEIARIAAGFGPLPA